MSILRRWWRRRQIDAGSGASSTDRPLDELSAQAADSLRALIDDPKVPSELRRELAQDYAEVAELLSRIEQGRLHLAVFGRVSVGKSSLLNALAGEARFATGVLHGTTTERAQTTWQEAESHGVVLIDTPGINELSGEDREALALQVASRSDLLLFVVDGDMTALERDALQAVAAQHRPVLLVLNKADRYGPDERSLLLQRLREHAADWVAAENVLAVAAQPADERVLMVHADGHEELVQRPRDSDIVELKQRILAILEKEGKALTALNAALFAGQLSDTLGQRLTAARADVAARITQSYCLAKGIAVALNPVPVADLLAAASLDVALVMHLARLYGLPLTRREAGQLLATITAQLMALMGAIWGVHLVASALKGLSAGLSTALTAGAQGALAWYATLLVARAAERYLSQGKSWGESGPKRVVEDILAQLDRDSILREARAEISRRLYERKPGI